MNSAINKSPAQKYSHWSPGETSLLKKLYPKIRVKELTKMFPGRTKGTIVAKALNLKLSSAKLWQPQEIDTLYKYFTEAPNEKLLEFLPKRSRTAILAKGERLGLKRKINKPRLKINESYFRRWSPNMAYLLGFILADGCIIKGSYKGYSDALRFGVHKQDIDILKKIKQELGSQYKISLVKNAAYFSINSQKIVNNLKALGISYRKSLQKARYEKIPNVPIKYIRDFIRGIVDGDGSINFDKKNYPALSICGKKKIITFIKNHFFSKFNLYSKITQAKKDGEQYNLFYIAYRCNSAQTLIKYLYNNANLYLERKFQLAKKCLSLKMKQRKNYTDLENQIIRRFYSSLHPSKILLMLPDRSWPRIQQQALNLGIFRYKKKGNALCV